MLTANNVSNLRVEGVVFEESRGAGVATEQLHQRIADRLHDSQHGRDRGVVQRRPAELDDRLRPERD